MDEIKKSIRTIPNFPKQGIMFRDITTLLKDPKVFKKTLDYLAIRYKGRRIDKVVGIEARGFIFGGALAYLLGVGFVPIRKKGKLPGETTSVSYELEYGTDTVEVHTDAISPGENVLVIDDLVATAGTCLAACQLVEKLGGKVVECGLIVDLPDLKGTERLRNRGYDVFSLIDFEGD
ncbi:MAG: adenine phosphoribosyltransferase [archaeon]